MKIYVVTPAIVLFLCEILFSASLYATEKKSVFDDYVNAGLIYKSPTAYGFKYIARKTEYWHCIWERIPIHQCN